MYLLRGYYDHLFCEVMMNSPLQPRFLYITKKNSQKQSSFMTQHYYLKFITEVLLNYFSIIFVFLPYH